MLDRRAHECLQRNGGPALDPWDLRVRNGKGGVYRDEPLQLNLWLNDRARALCGGHVVHIRLLLDEEALGAQLLNNFCARLRKLYRCELARDGEEFAIFVNNRLVGQVVTRGNVEVGHVVPGRDGHRAGAEGGVYGRVFDHGRRNQAINPLKLNLLAIGKRSVARVLWVHDHIFIAKFRLWARCGDGEWSVLQVIECRRLLLIDNLVVADGGLTLWVPIDDARAAVNEPRLIHALEGLNDRMLALFIKRVGVARPVERGAHTAYLAEDGALGGLGELADAAHQFFATDVVPALTLGLLDILLNPRFRRKRGRIGARHPEYFLTAHPRSEE